MPVLPLSSPEEVETKSLLTCVEEKFADLELLKEKRERRSEAGSEIPSVVASSPHPIHHLHPPTVLS